MQPFFELNYCNLTVIYCVMCQHLTHNTCVSRFHKTSFNTHSWLWKWASAGTGINNSASTETVVCSRLSCVFHGCIATQWALRGCPGPHMSAMQIISLCVHVCVCYRCLVSWAGRTSWLVCCSYWHFSPTSGKATPNACMHAYTRRGPGQVKRTFPKKVPELA